MKEWNITENNIEINSKSIIKDFLSEILYNRKS